MNLFGSTSRDQDVLGFIESGRVYVFDVTDTWQFNGESPVNTGTPDTAWVWCVDDVTFRVALYELVDSSNLTLIAVSEPFVAGQFTQNAWNSRALISTGAVASGKLYVIATQASDAGAHTIGGATASGRVRIAFTGAGYTYADGMPSAIDIANTAGGNANSAVPSIYFSIENSAATLSSPTSASVTQTGATIGATTDDNTGTLYGVVTTSASAPSATQIKAGQDHTGSAAAGSGSNASLTASVNNTIAITGLTAATSYYYYLVQDNGADSNVVNGTFTTAVAAPTLTSPTAVSIGTTTVTPRVTTDTGNGTCYYVITPQAESEPSNTQVEAGTNAADTTPVAAGSTVVSGTPPVVVTFSEVTGLTAGTAYRISYAHSGTPS